MSAPKSRPNKRVNPAKVDEAHQAYLRMHAQKVADMCGVSFRTASRWISGKTRIPYAAQVILNGDLEPFGGEEFRGWRAENGVLIAPNGLIITKADLEEARRLGLGKQPPTLPPYSLPGGAKG